MKEGTSGENNGNEIRHRHIFHPLNDSFIDDGDRGYNAILLLKSDNHQMLRNFVSMEDDVILTRNSPKFNFLKENIRDAIVFARKDSGTYKSEFGDLDWNSTVEFYEDLIPAFKGRQFVLREMDFESSHQDLSLTKCSPVDRMKLPFFPEAFILTLPSPAKHSNCRGFPLFLENHQEYLFEELFKQEVEPFWKSHLAPHTDNGNAVISRRFAKILRDKHLVNSFREKLVQKYVLEHCSHAPEYEFKKTDISTFIQKVGNRCSTLSEMLEKIDAKFNGSQQILLKAFVMNMSKTMEPGSITSNNMMSYFTGAVSGGVIGFGVGAGTVLFSAGSTAASGAGNLLSSTFSWVGTIFKKIGGGGGGSSGVDVSIQTDDLSFDDFLDEEVDETDEPEDNEDSKEEKEEDYKQDKEDDEDDTEEDKDSEEDDDEDSDEDDEDPEEEDEDLSNEDCVKRCFEQEVDEAALCFYEDPLFSKNDENYGQCGAGETAKLATVPCLAQCNLDPKLPQAYGAENEADLIISRGAGRFYEDFSNEATQNAIKGLHVCKHHAHKFGSKWYLDDSNYKIVRKRQHGSYARKKACAIEQESLNGHSRLTEFENKFLSKKESKSILKYKDVFLPIGSRKPD